MQKILAILVCPPKKNVGPLVELPQPQDFAWWAGVVWHPGIPENTGGKVAGSIPTAARPSDTSCLMLMMIIRIMNIRRIIRMMRAMTTRMRMMKLMKMKMRMRMNLRMIKDKDDKGRG